MPSRREIICAAAVLAPLVVVLFADRWVGGGSIYFSIVEEGFPVTANYPWDVFATKSIAAGRFPLWNPYQSCGNTFIANYLPAFFFLPRWFLYLSDGEGIRDLYVLLRFWLGGLFLYIFLRRISLKIPGAALAAISFLVGGYFTRYYNENYLNIDLFLGLWLLAGEELVRRRSLMATVAAGFSILLILLAGHPEAAFHALGLMTLWVLFRSLAAGERSFSAIALYVAAGCAAGVAACVQLIPFLEAFSQSANYHIPNLGRYHYELKHLASVAYPWIYGNFARHLVLKAVPDIGAGTSYATTTINYLPPFFGIVPLMFAGVAILKLKKANGNAAFFAIYFIALFAALFGIWPMSSIFAIPPLSRLGNYKHLFPELTLCVAVLAGMGLDLIIAMERKKAAKYLAIVMGVLVLLGVYAAGHKFGYPHIYAAIFGAAPLTMILILLLFHSSSARRIFPVAAIAMTFGLGVVYTRGYGAHDDGYLLTLKDAPFADYLRERIGNDRFMSLYPPVLPAFGAYLDIADIRGHDALQPAGYWDYLVNLNGLSLRETAEYFQRLGGFAPLPETLGEKSLDKLRLRYIASPGDLGGVIAANGILRSAHARTIGREYFHWDVWEKNSRKTPVLYTHPPIKLEYTNPIGDEGGKLEYALGWKEGASDERRDGAFAILLKNKKVVYARYIAPADKSWISVPVNLMDADTILVAPMENNYHDWLGWGMANKNDEFWGYRKVFNGFDAGRGQNPVERWKNIEVYEKSVLPPLFSLAENVSAPSKTEFPLKKIAADEFVSTNKPQLPVLKAYGFGWRPGWKLLGDAQEFKVIKTGPFEFYADVSGAKSLKLAYIPWGFKIGLWASLGSLISMVFLVVLKPKAQSPKPKV